MRFTRIITGTITAGLVGLVPVAVSSPANATETLTTVTTVSTYSTLPIAYGDEITLSTDVAASDGASAYKGTVALYASTPSVPAWTLVATGDTTYASFDVTPATNTAYKIVYSGYTAANEWEDTYVASESAPFAVTMTRKVVFNNPRDTLIKGKVTPDYKRKPIVVKKKVGKKWKKYKTFKTSRTGKYSFKLPAPRRGKFKWLITVKGDANFAPWATTGSTSRSRTVAPRLTIN